MTGVLDDPALVTLHVWGVPTREVPRALSRMALDRLLLARGRARFWKLLGTGRGSAFTPRDADPHHWALLSTWDDAADATHFEESATARAWDAMAHERLRVAMHPLRSRGTWSGRTPFGSGHTSAPRLASRDGRDSSDGHDGRDGRDGPVASITRARLRAATTGRFWRAVPPVAADLAREPGLRLAIGIGEAPVALMGTFSLWSDAAAMSAFAHHAAAHRDVMARTPRERWYAEELFARFAVTSVEGTHAGRAP